MLKSLFEIAENRKIAEGTFKMTLSGDASAITAPGQFVQIELPGLFLRRPISVCDWEEGRLTLIYKSVGRGTELMSRLRPGERLDLLTGLGNGFDTAASADIPSLLGDSPLLIGGGVGAAPLYGLAKRLSGNVTVALGWKTAAESFGLDEFADLGVRVLVATEDGSLGEKGFLTGLIKKFRASYVYACGPTPMLRAVSRAIEAPAQFSLEERMACGFGACVGCTIMTKNGPRRVCKDGPVFELEELLWE